MRPRPWVVALVTFLIVGSAASATAQAKKKLVERPPAPVGPRVSGFNPSAASTGTKVTLSGTGFIAADRVVVGTRVVKPLSVTDTALVFAAPALPGTHELSIRHPGAPGPIVAGTLVIHPDPRIVSFAPERGPVGTKIAVVGSGFLKGDQVTLGGK